eukprot:590999-Pyramimonas_sp.AAC.3
MVDGGELRPWQEDDGNDEAQEGDRLPDDDNDDSDDGAPGATPARKRPSAAQVETGAKPAKDVKTSKDAEPKDAKVKPLEGFTTVVGKWVLGWNGIVKAGV